MHTPPLAQLSNQFPGVTQFNTANLNVCKLILVILQRGKARNIPGANVERREASLCFHSKPPLDSIPSPAHRSGS